MVHRRPIPLHRSKDGHVRTLESDRLLDRPTRPDDRPRAEGASGGALAGVSLRRRKKGQERCPRWRPGRSAFRAAGDIVDVNADRRGGGEARTALTSRLRRPADAERPPASKGMAWGSGRHPWRASPIPSVRVTGGLAAPERPDGSSACATPLGVVGVIFESRPNVTADAGALCLKAGNAVSAARGLGQLPFLPRPIHACLVDTGPARAQDLPADSDPFACRRSDRAAVGDDAQRASAVILDVIVPRGGKIARRPRAERRRGCRSSPISTASMHVYVHAAAEPRKGEGVRS